MSPEPFGLLDLNKNLFLNAPAKYQTDGGMNLPFGLNRKLPPLRSTENAAASLPAQFDPSAFLIAQNKIFSNAEGSVSGDSSWIAATWSRTGTWLISRRPLLSHPNIPTVTNSKLLLLKAAGWFSKEWEQMGSSTASKFTGDFIAVARKEYQIYTHQPNLVTIIKQVNEGTALGVVIYDVSGRRKFPQSLFDKFWYWMNGAFKSHCRMMQKDVNLNTGDLIILVKKPLNSPLTHAELVNVFDVLGQKLSKLKQSLITGDLETIINRLMPTLLDHYGLTVSRCVSVQQFDFYFRAICGALKMEHLQHLDNRKCGLVTEPTPGSFGSTTRHNVIYRAGYYAALHMDASRLNRFKPTIDYMIRRLVCVVDDGKDSTLFARVPEVQYHANVLLKAEGKVKVAVAGGAVVVLLFKTDGKESWQILIHEQASSIITYSMPASMPVFVLLASPHFLFIGQEALATLLQGWNAEDVKIRLLQRILDVNQLDQHDCKLSLALFQIIKEM